MRRAAGALVHCNSFGSISSRPQVAVVDVLQVTVITSVSPSMATWPKNCKPKQGARFSPCSALQPFWYITAGPNVLSSSPGPQVPAWIGPDTNSQNGSKSWNAARFGIVIVRRRIMHVGGDPHRVAHARVLDEGQHIGDLELAAERRAVALRHGVRADDRDRQIGGDHLPGSVRCRELALEPLCLLGPEDLASRIERRVLAVVVRAAIAPHVEQEDVEQRPVGNLAIDAARCRPASAASA